MILVRLSQKRITIPIFYQVIFCEVKISCNLILNIKNNQSQNNWFLVYLGGLLFYEEYNRMFSATKCFFLKKLKER